jgi:hypothetical protein
MRNIASALRDIDFPNINCGGCGIAALAAVRLAKKHNEDVGIIFLYNSYDKRRYDTNQAALVEKNLDKWGMVPTHIAIVFDGIPVDTEGTVDMDKYQYTQTDITELDLLTIINFSDDWNDRFQRDKAIPRIEKILDIKLDDVKLEVIL